MDGAMNVYPVIYEVREIWPGRRGTWWQVTAASAESAALNFGEHYKDKRSGYSVEVRVWQSGEPCGEFGVELEPIARRIEEPEPRAPDADDRHKEEQEAR